ncbi:hypothetical protein [Flexivirga sp. B27]
MSSFVSSRPNHTGIDVPGPGTIALRNLYFVRFGFAVLWAGLFAATATTLNSAGVALLLVYPLFDVGAAIVDHRSSGAAQRSGPLRLNMALSAAATAGLAIAAGSGVSAVLRVWGAWAITAGAVQLVVAVSRRRMGGQLAMMLSGGISVLAGASFAIQAGASDPSMSSLAGYAALGGIFFLLSAIRLRRSGQSGQ